MNNNTENKDRTLTISEEVKAQEYVEGENPRSTVELNIPFSFDLCGIRPLSEYKRIALEDIRIKISTVFEMVEFFGEELRSGKYSNQGLITINEFMILSSVIGKGLAESLEVVENAFDRYEKKLSAETEKPAEDEPAEAEEKRQERTDRQRRTLEKVAHQLETALTSDETDDGVKECLKTIIFEASKEAGLPLGDMSLVRAAFPSIIEALPEDYGTGIYHSIDAILRYDTKAFQEFYDQRLDEKDEYVTGTGDLTNLANHISAVMKNPLIPTRLFNAMADELSTVPQDWRTPEAILTNLEELREDEADA